MTKQELRAKADALEAEAKALREEASKLHAAELLATPLLKRMVFAAYDRCPCGAGLAYDPSATRGGSVFKGPLAGYWDCSAIILGTADQSVKHTAQFPFAFYEVKSEGQPSVNGATTRPKPTS